MIRSAKFVDIPAMATLVKDSHLRSKYAGRATIHEKSLDQMLTALVAGQNQNGPQASYLKVCERGGEVVGFMAGVLGRIYNIGNQLSASDMFLINDNKNISETLKLIDGYIEWASANPKVIEIGLSWTNANAGGDVLRKIYSRKGFTMAGEQFVLDTDQAKREAA